VYRRLVATTVGALLEREHELETLRRELSRAGSGDGTLVLIEGPAGVGKTELVREARAAADRTGIAPLEARGSELERQFAFGVVRQMLEPAINVPDGSISSVELLAPPRASSGQTTHSPGLPMPDSRRSTASTGSP
jgi:AAA ATPase domain